MKGFTIIELILIISLLGILAGVGSPFISSFITRDNWHVATDRITSELWKAQSYAMEGKSINGSKVWGVFLIGNVFRLFNGDCNNPNYKEDFAVPNGISVTGISNLVFDNLRGEPDAAVVMSVTSNLGSSSISVNAAGMIDAN